MLGPQLAVSAPPRVLARLREAPDGPVRVLHAGPDAVYVEVYIEVDAWCVGVVGRRAAAVPCALRTTLEWLPPVTAATVRAGVLHLDERPLVVGRLVDVQVPSVTGSGPPEAIDAAALIGRGDGLTPYGDDVLCGWLAVHRAAGVPTPDVDEVVRSLSHRTTLLSATLLDCAMHGEVLPQFASWLSGSGSADELARVGHTSGRGLLEGGRRALAGLGAAAA